MALSPKGTSLRPIQTHTLTGWRRVSIKSSLSSGNYPQAEAKFLRLNAPSNWALPLNFHKLVSAYLSEKAIPTHHFAMQIRLSTTNPRLEEPVEIFKLICMRKYLSC